MRARTRGAREPRTLKHLAESKYFDRAFQSEAIKLLPGEYSVTARGLVLVTVLGSCVSACIRDRDSGIGGMNHFMLPDSGDSDPVSGAARYGAHAMGILVNHLLKLGARRASLEAKVFGGSRVMASLAGSQVGERNARFVLDYLATEQIPVTARDLLDIHPRKVYFFPSTGRVMVKKLFKLANDTLARREREYQAQLRVRKLAGDIEIFG
jgi:chemotaxis protein CheD